MRSNNSKVTLNNWQNSLSDNIKEDIMVAKPAKVIDYDKDTNTATVQILTKSKNSKGQRFKRAPLYKVPVWQYKTGEFCISAEIKKDTSGFLLFFDEDIHNFKKDGDFNTPETTRKHDLNDGIFIPGMYPMNATGGEATEGVLIGSVSTEQNIALKPNGDINIKNPKANVSLTDEGCSMATDLAEVILSEAGAKMRSGLGEVGINPAGDISIGMETIKATLKTTGEITIGNENCSIGMLPSGLITIGNDKVRIVLPI